MMLCAVLLFASTALASTTTTPGTQWDRAPERVRIGVLALRSDFARLGMEPEELAQLSFASTHDEVIDVFLSGKTNAGTMRSNNLERMALDGRPALDSLQHLSSNYQPVHELQQLVHLPPYEATAHPNLIAAFRGHMDVVGVLVLLLVGLLIHLYRRKAWNRSLLSARKQLETARTQQDEANHKLEDTYKVLADKEELLDKITNTAPHGIILLDDRGQVAYANRAAAQLLGYADKDLLGQDWHTHVVPPKLRLQASRGYREFTRTGTGAFVGQTISLGVQRKDGEIIPVEVSISGLSLNRRWHAIGIIRDVRERKRMEEALAEHTERFRALVEENRAGILILAQSGNVRFANPAATRLLSVPIEELKQVSFDTPSTFSNHSEVTVMRHDGSQGTAAAVITETTWKGASAFLVMLYDITERKATEEKMRQLAFEDTLTNLPNRSQFRLRLDQVIEQARRDNTGFALLFMDLDRFKKINDSLGHAMGDQLLQQVADRLGPQFRESDIVARMGGDEFTAIAYGADSEEAAKQVAERVACIFERPFHIEGQDFDVSTSIGISLYPHSSTDPDMLLRQADSAMYETKRNKGGGYSIFAPHIVLMSQSRFELEEELRNALKENQFRLFYQPEIQLHDGALVGMEGLLRWQHPHKGLLTPDAFITLLEDTGLILDVGRWVLNEACQQALQWQKDSPNLPVSVNISPIQVERSDLLENVDQAIRETGLDPKLLRLEMTETAMFRGAGNAAELLYALAGLGVELQIDDFGSSDSSLVMLRQLPFSVIKINRKYVQDIAVDAAKRALVKTSINMVHGMEKRIIAEGVENQAQLQVLSDLGCDAAQGYLFGKPLPANEIAL